MAFRVLLADDHVAILKGMSSLLSAEFEVIGTACTGVEMILAARRLQPDVIVADIGMPGISGIEASRQVLEQSPNLPIVLLTMHLESEILRRALEVGVLGYVHKLSAGDELIPAIHMAMRGEVFVSPSCTIKQVFASYHLSSSPG